MIAQAAIGIDWAQFGLGGAVIITLFGFIAFGVREVLKRVDKVLEQHDALVTMHQEERAAWRDEIIALADRQAEADKARDEWMRESLRNFNGRPVSVE